MPCPSRSEISQLRNYKFVKGNLQSADLIKYVLETEEIDTIIHAAAQVSPPPPCPAPPLDQGGPSLLRPTPRRHWGG